MKHSNLKVIFSLLLAGAFLPSLASASTSVISLSDSVSGTVQSNIAEGDYRVVDIAMVAGQPDKMRLRLQAVAAANEPQLYLFVPKHDYDQAHLNNGQIVTASKRPYGMAFSIARADQPFAVVLENDWQKDLASHAVLG
jgi:urate oxidase